MQKFNVGFHSGGWIEYPGVTCFELTSSGATFLYDGKRCYVSGDWYAEEVK